ncbi:WD repeat-containing protein 43 [Lobosporangium transversale]|uniref:WD40-repeat-containing domain protein n=1 Tax=Lobosporangium transversale TaxID=64571 RepID=A0A1Y2H0A8_9FUNG|nr:WD40-repeat-containing domain protein [Lobosporangium transversale]KAF9917831.1 WD repeat-containing protein 43 [Lobosporangium transversale]ORZ27955.1 WD40-repeat-containing domain protein [Lobosporangium transversale]|eukprot:XP_021885658.1 WD40-repeat-containing domain protein [Lobosporangium transversale]
MVKKAQSKTTFDTLQNPDQVSGTTVIVHSSFSPEGGHSYCIVTPGADHYRLRIFDTTTGAIKNNYEQKEGDGKWTCIRWGNITETGSNGTSKKKRKSSTGGSHSPVLALGHTNGHISIFSLVHGRVIKELSGSHTGKVNDFCFSKSGNRGFSAGEDGLVIEWDIMQGVEMSKLKTEAKSVKKIQLNHEETMLLTAGHNMKLWDLETRETIKDFTGHASAITNVVFSANDKFLASTAEQDRFINLWDCTRDNQQEGNITALTLDNTVSHIDISPNNAVLAISEEGTAGLWQNAQSVSGTSSSSAKANKKKRYTTRACDCSIKIESSRGDRALIPLLAGIFTPQGQMILARGSTIKPVFEKIDFQNEDGSLKEKEMLLTRAPVTGFLLDEAAQADSNLKATKKAYDESAVTVVGVTDFALPTAGMANAEDSEGEDGGDKDSTQMEGRTMEEKLQDLAMDESANSLTEKKSKQSASGSAKNKYPTPKANSLQQMLIQALHSNDLQLLEACLTFNNVEVIRNTVRRLPTAYVVPFLTQVIHKFQQKPNRGEALLEWIKAVLLIHTAYLMTVPDLMKKLSNFYQTLDSRVSVFQKMLNLHGRLDLVMNQIEMRQQYVAEDVTNEAATVYVEDEDDEEGEDLDLDMDDDDDDDDLVGEADAFDEEELGETDEEELESEMSDDDDDEVSEDEE